jgi:hypothetical protein
MRGAKAKQTVWFDQTHTNSLVCGQKNREKKKMAKNDDGCGFLQS